MSKIDIPIETKSIATLLDELITTDLKCYMAQEMITSDLDDVIIAAAARNAQSLNARRSQLMRAIDERLGEITITQVAKSYE